MQKLAFSVSRGSGALNMHARCQYTIYKLASLVAGRDSGSQPSYGASHVSLGFLQSEREVSYVICSYVFSGEIDTCNVHICATDCPNRKISLARAGHVLTNPKRHWCENSGSSQDKMERNRRKAMHAKNKQSC